MFQEMADEEFTFRLCAKEQSEAEGVEHDPNKGMGCVKSEDRVMGERRHECGEENVSDDQEELKVRRAT